MTEKGQKKIEMYCEGDHRENNNYYFSQISSSSCNAAFRIYLFFFFFSKSLFFPFLSNSNAKESISLYFSLPNQVKTKARTKFCGKSYNKHCLFCLILQFSCFPLPPLQKKKNNKLWTKRLPNPLNVYLFIYS